MSQKRNKKEGAVKLPLLPLLDGTVLLPGGFAKIKTGSESSAALVEHLLLRTGNTAREDVVVAAVPVAPDATDDEEGLLDLEKIHGFGTAARVVELWRQPNSEWVLILEGKHRIGVSGVVQGSDHSSLYLASTRQLDYFEDSASARHQSGSPATQLTSEMKDLRQSILSGLERMFSSAAPSSKALAVGARTLQLLQSYSPALTSDIVGSLLARTTSQRLALLSTVNVTDRLRLVDNLLKTRIAVREAEAAAAAGGDSSKSNRGGRQRGRSTNDSLADSKNAPSDAADRKRGLKGGGEEENSEETIEKLSKDDPRALLARLKSARPPAEVLAVATREVQRLLRTSDQHPGYAISLNYLETLADLPWSVRAVVPQNAKGPSLSAVRAHLDSRHCGLDKLKDRIVQYVAVQSLRGWDARAPILCFLGPPGVGKTSVARSVAAALHRPFHRISLGGVRDEAEIRGHRRTYIGALPGRVIQALRRTGACDAVLLLDEVDKIGHDARGDPAAALLEILDPEQNSAFVDTYLGVPVDLSKLVFIATANSAADIPAPLLDRMELIALHAYTVQEKVAIGERHLVPQALDDHGIPPGQLVIPAAALQTLIEGYTREAGVRGLNRCLGGICRHVAVALVAEAEAGAAAVVARGAEEQEGPDEKGISGEEILSTPQTLPGAPQPPSPSDSHAQCDAGFPEENCGSVMLLREQYPVGSGGYGLCPIAMAQRNIPNKIKEETTTLQSAKEVTSQSGGASEKGWFSWMPWHRTTDPQRSATAFVASSSRGRGQTETSGWEVSWATSGAGHSLSEGDPLASGAGLALRFLGPGSMAAAGRSLLKPGDHGALSETRQKHLPPPLPQSAAAPPLTDADGAIQPLHLGAPGPVVGLVAPRIPTKHQIIVDDAFIAEVLGPRKFEGDDAAQRVTSPGTAAGLVWTSIGGQLQYIECLCVGVGKADADAPGTLTLTGQLGDVLEESARIAISWARAHASALGLPPGGACPARRWDVHVHLPAGAVPKDGPSAGVTLAVALVSLFTGRNVRNDTALTGELTLRGLVLPVGGIKEKVIAAHAAGLHRVILPRRNLRDAEADVPVDVRNEMELIAVDRLEQALGEAFDPPMVLSLDNVNVGAEARL